MPASRTDVIEIVRIGGIPSAEMPVCVVAHGMPLIKYSLIQIRICQDILPDAKKCGLHAVGSKCVQHERGRHRVGPVIESEVDGRYILRHLPDAGRKQTPDPPWRTDGI